MLNHPESKPRIVTIVQARMGSTRLSGKLMKKVLEKPLIGYLMERLKRVQFSDSLVLATTLNPKDDILVDFCKTSLYNFFRGSEENVLERYYQCALQFRADAIVRICSDCPLIDPEVIDKVIKCYLDLYPSIDYVSNTLERTYPRGMDVEIFSFDSFKKVAQKAETISEREHVTPHYYLHSELFRLVNVATEKNTSHYRLTVDTEEDLKLIHLILEDLYLKKTNFSLNDILDVMKLHPDWIKINEHIQQKSI